MKKLSFITLFIVFGVYLIVAQQYKLLVGTYTNTGKSKGIYNYSVNVSKGIFTINSVAEDIENPSFLALDANHYYLYAVSESNTGSKAVAYAFNTQNGSFSLLNSSITGGKGPCFVAATRHHVFTANYGGGSVSAFGRNKNGSLTDLVQLIQQNGISVDPHRQQQSHVHQVLFTPNSTFMAVTNLGTDWVYMYRYKNATQGVVLRPHDSIRVDLGSGPRHLAFNKNGTRAYLLNELTATINVLKVNNGKLSLFQEITPRNQQGVENGAADIHLSPDGKFVYATNRGTSNSISCFRVGQQGLLTFVAQVSTLGNGPRNFAITPDGNYLFVGNQRSDEIVIFKRDMNTGELTDTAQRISVGAPVCLLFY